jgi:hypothetical protein
VPCPFTAATDFCGPPGLFLFPIVFALLPERLRAYAVQLVKPLVERIAGK